MKNTSNKNKNGGGYVGNLKGEGGPYRRKRTGRTEWKVEEKRRWG